MNILKSSFLFSCTIIHRPGLFRVNSVVCRKHLNGCCCCSWSVAACEAVSLSTRVMRKTIITDC